MQRIFIFGFSISYLYLAYILAVLSFANCLPINKQVTPPKWNENFDLHIINGERVTGDPNPNTYNFMVALKIHVKNDTYLCSGTMIQARTVLSAAHCFRYDNPVDSVDVLFFDPADSDYADKSNPAQTITVPSSDIIIHPDYGTNTENGNDIAVLHLGQDPNDAFYDLIEYRMTTSQVTRFYSGRFYSNGQVSVVAGWGLTESGKPSQYLLEADQEVIPNENCIWQINEDPWWDGSVMFCAVDKTTAGAETGPCSGDSGGPLFVESNGRYYEIGLVSWAGEKCNKDVVYTRVSAFEQWITNNLAAPLGPDFANSKDCKNFVKDEYKTQKFFCQTQYENNYQRKFCRRDAKDYKKDGIRLCKVEYI